MTRAFTEADLPVAVKGRGKRKRHVPYHIELPYEHLARHVLLPGDPGRAEWIAKNFLTNTVRFEHRGLVAITGRLKSGMLLTIVTSGMGEGSTEITVGELDILSRINLRTRKLRKRPRPLIVVRIGTSGALQKTTPLGQPVIAERALGLGAIGCYYFGEADRNSKLVEEAYQIRCSLEAIQKKRGVKYPCVPVFIEPSDSSVVAALKSAAMKHKISVTCGTTVTAPGFFGPQGRAVLKARLKIPNIDAILPSLDRTIQMYEMEAHALNLLMNQGIHRAATVCVPVAQRRQNMFAHPSKMTRAMKHAVRIAIGAFEILELQ